MAPALQISRPVSEAAIIAKQNNVAAIARALAQRRILRGAELLSRPKRFTWQREKLPMNILSCWSSPDGKSLMRT